MSILTYPSNFTVTQANRQVLAQWNQLSGASSYILQRSLDNVTYTTIATVTSYSYVDTTVTAGTLYYYQVAGVDSTSTTGLFTPSLKIIPTPTGEMSLAEIRQQARERADRVNSNFFTTQELNNYINSSMFELYDILVTAYEDYFLATPVLFQTDGISFNYPLPDGVTTFMSGINPSQTIVGAPIDKLVGVDLGVNTVQGAWVTLSKFQFIDRNRYVYPNSQSTLYGVFNLQYRMMGNVIQFIPTPSGNQYIRLWYIPRLQELLQDTDITTVSISRWVDYIITDVAIKMLQKEESDVSVLMAQKMALKKRIEEASQNRDAGQPDKINDSRGNTNWGSGGYSGNAGNIGGW